MPAAEETKLPVPVPRTRRDLSDVGPWWRSKSRMCQGQSYRLPPKKKDSYDSYEGKVVAQADLLPPTKKAIPGVYRKVLPSTVSDFTSPEGKQLFREAIQGEAMECYYKLSSIYQTQSELTFCGLCSLSMVLNALGIDPERIWKGQWRWYDEYMLDFGVSLGKVKMIGISFGKLARLAINAGAYVEAFQTDQISVDDFRRLIIRCCGSEDRYVISSYNRKALKQDGAGHFSPIGGYHVGRDMVLILDVARYKYPSHWVPVEDLWKAMNTVDRATGQRRGFMIVYNHCKEPGLLYTLSCKHESWLGVAQYLVNDVPVLLMSIDFKDLKQVFIAVCMPLLSKFGSFIESVAREWMPEDGDRSLYQAESCYLMVLFLALPIETWSGIKDEKLSQEIHRLVLTENLSPLLQKEVLSLRQHLQLFKSHQDRQGNELDEDVGALFLFIFHPQIFTIFLLSFTFNLPFFIFVSFFTSFCIIRYWNEFYYFWVVFVVFRLIFMVLGTFVR